MNKKETPDSIGDPCFEIPINGTLDLHTFQPREVAGVVVDYLEECRRRNILEVRIIHGKGIGNLRRTVEATLKKMTIVDYWQPASHDAGHWGATLVRLKQPD